MIDEVKLVRISIGQDIIGKVSFVSGNYIIKDAVQIGMMENQQGVGVMMAPVHPLSKDKTFVINEKFVIFVCEPIDEVKNQYLAPSVKSVNSSGLIMPN